MAKTNKLKLNAIIQVILFLLLVGLDQLTKQIALHQLKDAPAVKLIDNVLYFSYLENTGAAFGIFQNKMWLFYVITAIVVIILALLVVHIYRRLKRYMSESGSNFSISFANSILGLTYIFTVLCAGAVGNLIDRIAYNHVIDFIYLKFINFPVFNVADICVTLSAAAMIIFFIFIYKDNKDFHLFTKQ